MHIALVIYSLKFSGGAERVLSNLANYWISKNHTISLITLDSKDANPFYPIDNAINLIQINQTGSELSIIKRGYNILKRIFSLRTVIKNIKPNLIISFVDVMNITSLIATINLKIPIIASERTDPNYYKLPIFYNMLRKIFYFKAYKVITQTESAAKYFKNLLKNIKIIPNPVFKPLLLKSNILKINTVVSVGRLCKFKGFDVLILAMAKLIKNYTNLKLIIYGEGYWRKNLENLINSLNLQNTVYLPGAVYDIQAELIKADLFVFPSLYEGFPNALCEAMAVGLPVIASNCSGNTDIVRDKIDGLLFSIGDVDRLYKTIEDLINNQEHCNYLAANAKQICERFNQNKIFALWDELLVNIV